MCCQGTASLSVVLQVRRLAASDRGADIVLSSWLLECAAAPTGVVPLLPRHYLHMSSKTRNQDAVHMDAHGCARWPCWAACQACCMPLVLLLPRH